MDPFRMLLNLLLLALAAQALQLRPVARVASPRLNEVSKPLSLIQAPRFRPRFMSNNEETPDKDTSSLTSQDSEAVTSNSSELETSESNTQDNSWPSSSGGLTRTLLLATPLFCKFVIVLVIKFLTDLVVFPLLFMYRLARLMKRRILKAFRRDNDSTGFSGKINGASGSETIDSSAS